MAGKHRLIDKRSHFAEVKAHIKANWSEHFWGLMDCDRCPSRGDTACDDCKRWPYWVRDFEALGVINGIKIPPMEKVQIDVDATMKTILSSPAEYDGYGQITITHPDKGYAKIADVRGWGFLTGGGSGALGLPEKEAVEIQTAIGVRIAYGYNSFCRIEELLNDVLANCTQTAMLATRCAQEHGDNQWLESIHANASVATTWIERELNRMEGN